MLFLHLLPIRGPTRERSLAAATVCASAPVIKQALRHVHRNASQGASSRGFVLRELPSGGRRAVRIDSKIGKRFAVHRGAIQQT